MKNDVVHFNTYPWINENGTIYALTSNGKEYITMLEFNEEDAQFFVDSHNAKRDWHWLHLYSLVKKDNREVDRLRLLPIAKKASERLEQMGYTPNFEG